MRQEKIRIDFCFNKETYYENERLIKILFKDGFPIEEGDRLEMNYNFYLAYLDETNTKMEVILQLMKIPGLIKKISHKELIHHRCVLEELLLKLKEMEAFDPH